MDTGDIMKNERAGKESDSVKGKYIRLEVVKTMKKRNGFAMLFESIRQVKRFIIFVIGVTVILIGIVMIFLPGPAIIVIPLGLLILATEFVWARILLDHVKGLLKRGGKNKKGR
jgi:hypothetical protein